MSSYSFDKRVRCWTCKANGIDRSFEGGAERQLHESTMHASRFLSDSCKETSTLFCSVADRSSTNCKSFGTSFTANRLPFGSVSKQTSQMKPCFMDLMQLKEKVGRELKLTDINAITSSQARYADVSYNDRNNQKSERESYSIRLEQALNEISSKNSMVNKLKEDLDGAEVTLMQAKGRESRLEDQLDLARREIKKIKQELHNTAGIAVSENLQRVQQQKDFEGRLNSQKVHIMKLREELEKHTMASKEIQANNEIIIDLERKLSRSEKELEFERRLKIEAKKDRDECQKEVDELLTENENMKKRLRQHQHHLEELQNEHRDLIEEYNSIGVSANNEILQLKLLEAEEYLNRKFNNERENFTKDIEGYRKQCENLESKCHDHERTLEKCFADLKKARNEIANSEAYRQDDIERLLREKESLKADLKAKKISLQHLEQSNEEMVKCLEEKEKRMRKLERMKCSGPNSHNAKTDYLKLEKNFHQKCQQVEELKERIKNLESAPRIRNNEKPPCNENVRGMAGERENEDLKKKLQNLEGEKKEKEVEIIELIQEKEELKESVKTFEDKSYELQQSLNEALDAKTNFENELARLRNEMKSRDEEISAVKKIIEDLDNNKEDSSECQMSNTEIKEMKDELERCKADIQIKLKEMADLEASFEEERDDKNEKLDQVLEANVEIEEKCNQLEAIINEKEAVIQQLQEAQVDKRSNERELQDRVSKLENDVIVKENAAKQLEEQLLCLEKHDKELQNKLTSHQAIEIEAKKLESTLEESNKNIDMLKATVFKLEENIATRDNALQESEKRNMKLNEQNTKLQSSFRENDDLLNTKKKELQDTADKLERSRERMKKLEISLKDLEKLKKDLQSKTEEFRQSLAKQDDLFKKLQNKEKQCESLERQLKEVGDKCKKDGAVNSSCKSELVNLQNKYTDVLEDLKAAQESIDMLTNDKEVLRKENEDLKRILEERQASVPLKNNDKNEYELKELRESLENMKEREKKIQSHNYALKKRLDKEEAERKTLKEQIVAISNQLKKYKARKSAEDSATSDLKREIENWQRKFDDLAMTLADTESNMHIINENSSKMAKELKKENKTLEEKIDKANFLLLEKQNELVLLEKRCENYKELSEIVEKKTAEIKAKNKYIEDIGAENSKLVAEVRKQERVIRELEDKIEVLESDKDELEQEKNIFEKQLKGEKVKVIKSTNNDSLKANDDIKTLIVEKETLQRKNEELQKMVKDEDNTKDVEEISEASQMSNSEKQTAEYEYESDFEEDDDGDDKSFASNSQKSHASKTDEPSSIIEEVIESDDSDDFWNALDKKESSEFEHFSNEREENIAGSGENDVFENKVNVMEPISPESSDHRIKATNPEKSKQGVLTHEGPIDDEDDMLKNFVAEQKKKSKKTTNKKTKMVADDEIGIEDLIADIEADDETETGKGSTVQSNQPSTGLLSGQKHLALSAPKLLEKNKPLPPLTTKLGSFPPLKGMSKR